LVTTSFVHFTAFWLPAKQNIPNEPPRPFFALAVQVRDRYIAGPWTTAAEDHTPMAWTVRRGTATRRQGRWAMGDGRWAMGDGRWNGRPTVQPLQNGMRHAERRTVGRLAWAAALGLGLCGCGTFWDDVTSRDFSMRNLFVKKDPVEVLKEDKLDGDARQRALGALHEPLRNGGSQQDQDIIVNLLVEAATKDAHPLCRLAAIRTLGKFKDPRAAETIEIVYLQDLRFGQEQNSIIRQSCLTCLAETGGAVALRRLIVVAKEPPANVHRDQLETLDRRLTAVRGLGKFKEPEAAAALAYVLRSEEDIALRDRAHESLEECTGKHLPADSPQWAAYVGQSSDVQQAGVRGTLTNGGQNTGVQTAH
jgi:hypothetical protein